MAEELTNAIADLIENDALKMTQDKLDGGTGPGSIYCRDS